MLHTASVTDATTTPRWVFPCSSWGRRARTRSSSRAAQGKSRPEQHQPGGDGEQTGPGEHPQHDAQQHQERPGRDPAQTPDDAAPRLLDGLLAPARLELGIDGGVGDPLGEGLLERAGVGHRHGLNF